MIVDSQLHRGKLEYLVYWKGFTIEHDSWEPEANLKNSKKYITEFYKRRPSAPCHLSSTIFEGYTWRELRNFTDIRVTTLHEKDYAPGYGPQNNGSKATQNHYDHDEDGIEGYKAVVLI